MNNLKKIGLSALAGSLVATSAFAGEMSVAGGASINVEHTNGGGGDSGKTFSMGNQLTFSGGGELDNGLNVALSFVIDQGDDTAIGSGPFDSHSVTISSDAMGTLKFSGEGGSSAQGAMDTTAAGDIWNNGLGLTGGPTAAASGNNSLYYTLPAMVDGVAITASMSPSRAAQETHMSFGLVYTGVEGLTAKFGQGDSGAPGAVAESTTMMASYAIGSFTVSASNTDVDNAGSTADVDVTSYQLAYTVSDDLSVTYGTETFETAGSAIDEEVEAFGVSYTTGGMTLSANTYEATGGGNTAGASTDKWALTAAFAF